MELWRNFKRQALHSLKIGLGNAVCAIVVFVPSLTYPYSYLAPIMYLIVAGLGADTVHVGAHAIAAMLTLSGGVLGACFSAAVILASPNMAVLLLLGCLIMIPMFISLRFGTHFK